MSANIDNFVRKLQETLGGDFSVAEDTTVNNGVLRECVLVSSADSSCGGAMVLYADDINRALKALGLDGAVEQFAKTCREQAGTGMLSNEIADRFRSLTWEDVKGEICMKAVNEGLAKNDADALYFMWHRLPIIFSVRMSKIIPIDGQEYTVRVPDRLAKAWGIGTKELTQAAIENSDSTPILKPLEEIIGLPVQDIPGLPRLYVLMNHTPYGFSCVAQPGVLDGIGEKIGNFFILPSSIHEAILVTGMDRDRVEDVKSMVFETNRSDAVGTKDFLSDLIWYYDAETRQVIDL